MPVLRGRLVPPGAPTAGLRCRYGGLNGSPWQLRACPADDGSMAVVVLAYPGRPDVDVWVKLNGCPATSNGYIASVR